MRNSSLHKFVAVILGFVEPDYAGNTEMFENLQVVLWCIAATLKSTHVVQWAHESDELARDDPVQVSIFDTLVVLVLLSVKSVILFLKSADILRVKYLNGNEQRR